MIKNIKCGATYNSEVDLIVQQLITASPQIAAAYECQKQRYESRVAAALENNLNNIKPYNVWFLEVFRGINAADNSDVLLSKNM